MEVYRWLQTYELMTRKTKKLVKIRDNWQKQPPEVFCKKSVPKNFITFLAKHLRWSLYLIKLQAWETPTQVFSCKICEIFKNIYFDEHLRMAACEMIWKAICVLHDSDTVLEWFKDASNTKSDINICDQWQTNKQDEQARSTNFMILKLDFSTSLYPIFSVYKTTSSMSEK